MTTTTDGKRIAYAPFPYPSGRFPISPITVMLAPDEEVEWHWTHYPNGGGAVTGYTVKKATIIYGDSAAAIGSSR